MDSQHTFCIPVMGTGFSVDMPARVAKYGITSTVSLVDDTLIEKMREHYCELMGEEYVPIKRDDEDARARRITAYLDLLDRIVKKQFNELKETEFEPGTEITKYFDLLPEKCPLKVKYNKMLKLDNLSKKQELQKELRDSMAPGRIDVNIMTRLDRTNFSKDGKELPAEYSDALSAFRGYAQSKLDSAIVFSAGINRRLYNYIEQFKDFFTDKTGGIKKKIVLKVSDYRSAFTQGKFFAKKGLWVSEYRIESGLNCGGHAFATTGYLMGPILEEFKKKKSELIATIHKIYNQALELKKKVVFSNPLKVDITAQGGIGTVEEDVFLQEYYQVDGTGWATPFLLVPEATSIDSETLEKLRAANEDDLYISDVSPMNVPFNNVRGSSSDCAQEKRIEEGHPGSKCVKTHLAFNSEFTQRPICTASRLYQKLKLEQLEKLNLKKEEFKEACKNIVVKTCICDDLGGAAIIANNITNGRKFYPAVCPGPNIAYFSKVATLKEMVDNIYGRACLLNGKYRPHMFVKELKMYVDYLQNEVKKCVGKPTEKQIQYFNEFKKNLFDGVEYYCDLFSTIVNDAKERKERTLQDLMQLKENLEGFISTHQYAFEKNR